ncbi:UDP-N-acetylmuramoyl-tripeptide--D-alanyl-D-alanine ligase [Flavobacteriaceae bacterium UJ101]|nr:UDP-N-acetylmuramoyl-tripeptide--D-alanyl-D-alanine ligase [Flavobacteriaceae bacterium UJ101]
MIGFFIIRYMNSLENIYTLYTETYKVSTDTRNIEKNSLFFALKGANFNGNKFAQQALEKGALAAIVDEAGYVTSDKMILVDDVLETLQDLAQYHRRKLGLPIISLTGSNGKTTTKELIVRVLSKKFNIQATKGNLNNHIGVPLTLLSILPSHEMGVVEMGANHQKEIEMLCDIAEPDFGYITNFGKAHLEGFGGIEGVIKGKTELYQYLKKEDKKVLINIDDPIQVEKSKGIQSYFFGKEKGNVLIREIENSTPFVSVFYSGLEINTHLIGSYNFTNIASAIAIGDYFEIEAEKIQEAIEGYIPENNRSQIMERNGKQILLDAYNANPSSIEVALENFSKLEGRKTVILGDMFELGSHAVEEHQKIVDLALEKQFDQVIVVGEYFYETQKEVIRFRSTETLIEYLKENNEVNEKILIKGSRGMKLETIVDFL